MLYCSDNVLRRYSLNSSPGANYRAACVGKSDKDFLNKLKMVEEELDETAYWLELIMELELVKPDLLQVFIICILLFLCDACTVFLYYFLAQPIMPGILLWGNRVVLYYHNSGKLAIRIPLPVI